MRFASFIQTAQSITPPSTAFQSYVWGYNNSGWQTLGLGSSGSSKAVPTLQTTTQFLSASPTGYGYVDSSGKMYAWGVNSNGECGVNNTTMQPAPIRVGTDTDWAYIIKGPVTLAIKTNGALYGCGSGSSGMFGNGSTSTFLVPTQIGTSTWKQIYCAACTLGIKTDGTLWSSGPNTYGYLGHGDTTARTTFTQVGTATNWKKVVVSPGIWSSWLNHGHVLALREDGTLWTWGRNDMYQLGLGDTTDRYSPVQIGTSTDWKDIAVGGFFSAAIKTNGTLWMWGNNASGQLGVNDVTSRSTPTQVGTATDWKQVSCSADSTGSVASFTLAIKTDGSMWGWGTSGQSQLGNNYVSSNIPVRVGSSSSDWKQVVAYSWAGLGLRDGGTEVWQPSGTTRRLSLSFTNGVLNQTDTYTLTPTGSISMPTTGGVQGGYGSGWSNTAFYSVNELSAADSGKGHTYIAWYKGTQTNSSTYQYSPGVPVFGDNRGSVYMGLGMDSGKICVANDVRVLGTTNCATGNWVMLAWVFKANNTIDAYVNGNLEISGKSVAGSTTYNRVDQIGNGYAYVGVSNPTALDGIQIYSGELTQAQLQEIYSKAV